LKFRLETREKIKIHHQKMKF